ncbi:204L [Invertebrate iridescent virus 6]|uniref:204L n=1 Tax=Invertebrate iridescent virus 6 TaxID=176652 RepID=Q91FW6_IIV6|nr:204L [Invertebrate iridescent virus 6]AAK82066.1 204L [Invertebrate iridescent virus 6]
MIIYRKFFIENFKIKFLWKCIYRKLNQIHLLILIKKNVHSNINNNKYCYIYSLVNIYFWIKL